MKRPAVAGLRHFGEQGKALFRIGCNALATDEGTGIGALAGGIAIVCGRFEEGGCPGLILVHVNAVPVNFAQADIAVGISGFCSAGQVVNGPGAIHRHRAAARIEITKDVEGIPVARRGRVFQVLQCGLRRGFVRALPHDLAQFLYARCLRRGLCVTVRGSRQDYC